MGEGPRRVQLSRKKGWRMPPNTMSVARPTKWGNPFPVTKDCDRAEAVRRFRTFLCNDKKMSECLDELRGKNLACWCPLNEPCHADVLLELADPNH